MSNNNINNNGDMNTPKLKQLVNLVEGLGGFDNVAETGGSVYSKGITFFYDDEEEMEVEGDEYKPNPPIDLIIQLNGKVYLNEIPVILDLTKEEVKEAYKYIGETDEFPYTEYEGKYYPHLTLIEEDGAAKDGVFIMVGKGEYAQVG